MKQALRNKLITLKALGFVVLSVTATNAQSVISGRVVDQKNVPVRNASIYLDNTIDGATSDSTGAFSFTTEEKGAQTLVASEVGHENAGLPITVNGDVKDIVLKMKEAPKKLDEVVVTAGSFEASDKGKTVLSSLDIVTTAGSQADVVKAIQTLPGTQQQGTQTGLFVRGGDASEAAFVVDGLIAQNAFFSTAPGVAARSRFGPFQFKGVAFSSGGYSARYGQALSSVLELNSNDMPDKSTINTGINMAGVYFSGAKLLKNTSLEGSAYYNNLSPFYGIAKTNMDFYDVPKGGGGSARYVHKPNKDGIIKALVNYTTFSSGTRVPNPAQGKETETLDFGVKNQYGYGIVSYRQMLKEKWNLYVAGSYTKNQDDIKANTLNILNKDDRAQFRAEAKRYVNSRLSILAGTEVQNFTYHQAFDTFKTEFTETQVAGYAEADWTPIYWLAFKPGVRYEHSGLLEQNSVSPRLALAIKAGKNGQFSVASGIFYQIADPQYFLQDYKPGLQRSIHYIANYQLMKNDRILRIEGYYKDYDQLVRELGNMPFNPAALAQRTIAGPVSNTGDGYATGAELFWRDKKSIKNADYWISYSYIDTRRIYRNYLEEVQPDFIATHNLNIVTKYFIPKWQTQINTTYSYSSGRPYFNPDPEVAFMSGRTPEYHNLSIAINYLTSIKKWFTVIYGGVDNVTNAKNVFGYRYSGGQAIPTRPALYRSVFVGVNFSLTEFDKDEL
ncbi:TonB-dependent receptor [Polluticoccus soli]|uniref:TonB-dependent receptor n=1 Tax=Polluticoccus soli TaxID=3034150 RepID=UPI0023E1DABF|nr:TonB-dependent receptor [Flavipsychrobacter sp. JY13-12]